MKIKKIMIGGALLVVGLPVALLARAPAWFRMEGKTNGAIVTSSQTSKCLLYVPKTDDRSRPTPLLISLHPAATRPAAEMGSIGGTIWPMSTVLLSFTRREAASQSLAHGAT